MAGGVLVAMLFVILLFAGHSVLPIMLLVVLLAAAGWAVSERRGRARPPADHPVNGNVALSDAELPAPPN
jgi:hypothetical protein